MPSNINSITNIDPSESEISLQATVVYTFQAILVSETTLVYNIWINWSGWPGLTKCHEVARHNLTQHIDSKELLHYLCLCFCVSPMHV
jgi:hypothetical protein